MCYESPGPRCYNDSNKTLIKKQAKLDHIKSEIRDAEKLLEDAAKKSNFTEFAKLRKTINVLNAKKFELETDIRYTQRDVDSTKTGMKMLDDQMAEATSKSELKVLDNRRKAAQGLRYAREHALQLKKSGLVPVINFTVAQAA